ncbi:hypothetical protein CHS0354_038650 [Potamilus streckersoni]|uniref:Ig-like domain-containing protein n=1 Tax=Potamilus streckersoni TaxID=2493646 RepID=A0AAE0T8M4_9BIVA|nr:hypothetical protein CHS0354_038650 [Potamilus streckersoni]
MERIAIIMLLIFVFCVKNIAECSTDTFVVAGWNVSLYWTLVNSEITSLQVNILNSTGSKIAELSDNECTSNDDSFYCNISNSTAMWILSLDIHNVSARQSGNYVIQTYQGFKPTNISYVNLVVIGLMYKWRINDKEITPLSNVNVYNISSVGMDINFNNVTCRVCLNETASNVLRVNWKYDNCSTDSDTYTIHVIYGPTNISLNLSEINFYLKDDEFFAIDCFANCKPNCTFRWKGQDTIDNSKLIFPNFEPRMAGQYTCYVTNQETNATSKSNTIILHHVKDNNIKKEDNIEVIGMGLVGVAVLLMVIGHTLLVQWCRNSSNKKVVNRQTPTNEEMSQVISRIQNRPLPDHNTQETASRRPTRPKYPNLQRKSRSLYNLLDSAQDSFSPLRGGLSLQALQPSPNINGRNHKNGKTDHATIKERRFSSCEDHLGDESLPENVQPDALYANARNDRITSKDKQKIGAKFESLRNIRQESFEHESQEDLYNTIDEAALSVYDYARDNSTNKNSTEEPMNTNHGDTDYDYADLPFL